MLYAEIVYRGKNVLARTKGIAVDIWVPALKAWIPAPEDVSEDMNAPGTNPYRNYITTEEAEALMSKE